jgi:hypothetical protein
MKDFTNVDCCINCENFCEWDGDYCCFPHFMIHQYNIKYYPEYDNKHNGGYFSDDRMFRDIDKTMVLAKDCEDYKKYGTGMRNPDYPNVHLEEYKRFKEWDKLCYQLEEHVSDKSGLYEQRFKKMFFKGKF